MCPKSYTKNSPSLTLVVVKAGKHAWGRGRENLKGFLSNCLCKGTNERCMINAFCCRDIKGSGAEPEVKASVCRGQHFQQFGTALWLVPIQLIIILPLFPLL